MLLHGLSFCSPKVIRLLSFCSPKVIRFMGISLSVCNLKADFKFISLSVVSCEKWPLNWLALTYAIFYSKPSNLKTTTALMFIILIVTNSIDCRIIHVLNISPFFPYINGWCLRSLFSYYLIYIFLWKPLESTGL